jgi:threonine dehydrogenase-like Zn-dependent dehydrogenase
LTPFLKGDTEIKDEEKTQTEDCIRVLIAERSHSELSEAIIVVNGAGCLGRALLEASSSFGVAVGIMLALPNPPDEDILELGLLHLQNPADPQLVWPDSAEFDLVNVQSDIDVSIDCVPIWHRLNQPVRSARQGMSVVLKPTKVALVAVVIVEHRVRH